MPKLQSGVTPLVSCLRRIIQHTRSYETCGGEISSEADRLAANQQKLGSVEAINHFASKLCFKRYSLRYLRATVHDVKSNNVQIPSQAKQICIGNPRSFKSLPDTEHREFLAAKVCGDRKSEDVPPMLVQGGAAICWSSRVTRNWIPLQGSLSNISRFSIVTDCEEARLRSTSDPK
jgi:hypothetical protein